MSEKLCMFCTHFGWEQITDDAYWGAEGGARCNKGHFRERRPCDEAELREILLQAAKCPDYDEAKGAKL